MNQYLDIFRTVILERQSELTTIGLNSEIKTWNGIAVLKLQKPNWTDGDFGQGVFFSVWIDPKDKKKNIAKYNIHALKLRLRKDYDIKANDFAEAFRKEISGTDSDWPNLSLKYGPQTLIEGWIELKPDEFRNDVDSLIDHFLKVQHVIDKLLEERKIA